ncbi:MAG: DUF2063 domain-containing protein [Polyangiaceae bacterium]|nr:DUF2063 domain-containing protein [Polyangiaceae bacterium]
MSAERRYVEPRAPESLRSVQSFLTDAFRRPAPVAGDESLRASCAMHVTSNDRLTPAEQVDIYRRQYWLRHDDALHDDFPTLAAALGHDGWHSLVRDYLVAHPPSTPSLRDLGVNMPAFLERWDGLPEGLEALCLEAARYEIAFLDVFDGADPPPLDPKLVASLSPNDWERATFVLSPLVKRFELQYPVNVLRLVVRDDASTDVREWARQNAKPTSLALFRKDLVVHYEELVPDAFRMLDALAEGKSLIEACSIVAEGKSEADATALGRSVGDWFRRWSSWGFIAKIEL